MPNTHHRRDADATQLHSWVASASAVCIGIRWIGTGMFITQIKRAIHMIHAVINSCKVPLLNAVEAATHWYSQNWHRRHFVSHKFSCFNQSDIRSVICSCSCIEPSGRSTSWLGSETEPFRRDIRPEIAKRLNNCCAVDKRTHSRTVHKFTELFAPSHFYSPNYFWLPAYLN